MIDDGPGTPRRRAGSPAPGPSFTPCPSGAHPAGCPTFAPGRYCLAVCYCGHCPHWRPQRMTGRRISTLTQYLRHAPRYENNSKRAGSAWQTDQFDERGITNGT